MSFIGQVTNSKFNLFIGNIAAAKDAELLKTHNIGFIINVSEVQYESKIPSLEIVASGANYQTIIQKIAEMLETTNVFVYCEVCKIRAPTIAILWLKLKCDMDTKNAHEAVLKVRPETSITPFMLMMIGNMQF